MSSGHGIDADVFRVRAEGELADCRHAVLACENDHIGARQRRRRCVGRKRMRIRKLTLHRARLNDGNLRLFRESS